MITEKPTRPDFKDLTDAHFDMLMVSAYAGKKVCGKILRTMWLCLCSCGNTTIVMGQSLRSGNTRSCGCLVFKNRHRKHGMYNSRIYGIWTAMKGRCLNPRDGGYMNYGARGITVCMQWLEFPPFYDWVVTHFPDGQVPKGLTLDRRENDKGYSPENCRWITRKEQNRNHRRNRFIEFNGERLCLEDWAKRIGIRGGSLLKRLRLGWSLERALHDAKQPVSYQRFITYNGRTQPLSLWAKEAGLSLKGLSSRLARDWPIHRALTTPPLRQYPVSP